MNKVKYNSKKGHRALKAKRERTKGSTIIPYPKTHSESDSQSYVLNKFLEQRIDAKSEVFSQDLTCRFDIVVFKETLPQRIIEIKKEGESVTVEQAKRYERFNIPITYIYGSADAFEFNRTEIGIIKEEPLINNFQGKVADKKKKVLEEGQPCRKCGDPVVKRLPLRRPKPGQTYYFKSYLYCISCGTMYLVNSEKVFIK